MLSRLFPAVAVAGSAHSISELPGLAVLAADDECTSTEPSACSLNALQMQVSSHTHAQAGCHSAQPGDECHATIHWVRSTGLKRHPERYRGLTSSSSNDEIQERVHSGDSHKCPRPCKADKKQWCSTDTDDLAFLWPPASNFSETYIKVLSYNLFWWHLFGVEGGADNSAAKLILKSNTPYHFDVMGFQECDNVTQVFAPLGLDKDFEPIQGDHAMCAAYRRKTWSLIAKGGLEIAEDMSTVSYGKRGLMWMRLKNTETGASLFFVNHHGPLSVNSGGICGGRATAGHLLKTIRDNAQVGDVVMLVGDFNANAASLTVRSLWTRMVHVFAGQSFGGVDNVFSNVPTSNIVTSEILGGGGSDHDAITATLRVGASEKLGAASHSSAAARTAAQTVNKGGPGCGVIEANVEYEFRRNDVLAHPVSHQDHSSHSHHRRRHHSQHSHATDANKDHEACCRACQAVHQCVAWLWKDYVKASKGPQCILSKGAPKVSKATVGFISGVPYWEAARKAHEEASHALVSITA